MSGGADPKRAQLERLGVLRQFDFLQQQLGSFLQTDQSDPPLSRRLLLDMHRAAAEGWLESAGEIRVIQVMVGSHSPPAPEDVNFHLNHFFEDFAERWRTREPDTTSEVLELAAWTLWKLNWIHPFRDGNGRTSRAASYLVLQAGLQRELPGRRTLVEHMATSRRRDQYLAALRDADHSWSSLNVQDVSQLRNLLEELLALQLEGAL